MSVDTLNADLATLRGLLHSYRSVPIVGGGVESGVAALARVEAELSRLREERDALMRATWRCYVVSGADPDGNDRWHTSAEMACKASVDAVEQLRSDYNEALDENRAAEARCARLQQALDTLMAKAQHHNLWWLENRIREALAGPADSQEDKT